MEYYSTGYYIYTGWGWVLWIGLGILMISGVSHWGHSYINHRKHLDSLKLDSQKTK